jgi:hypothetical protein
MIDIKPKARLPERSEGSPLRSPRFFWLDVLRLAQEDVNAFKYLHHAVALYHP